MTLKVQLKFEDNDSFFSLSFLTGKNETFEILTSVKVTQKKLEQWGGPYLCLARGKNKKMKYKKDCFWKEKESSKASKRLVKVRQL